MNFKKIIINDWKDISSLEVDWSTKVYRGQLDASWYLQPSLLRLFNQQRENSRDTWVTDEYYLLKAFRRRAHQYESNLPDKDDLVGWFSLMQHHGTPTRLLDFTYSFYIAAYFAIVGSKYDAAIWAIDDNYLREFGCAISGEKDGLRETQLWSIYDYANDFLIKLYDEQKGGSGDNFGNEEKGVLMLEPEIQNSRLGIQQGLFLMPLNIHVPFLDNLFAMPDRFVDRGYVSDASKYVTKIILKEEIKETVVAHLNKMNITAETLFPGIDGFARSLTQVEFFI